MSDTEHVKLREYIERILDEREKAVNLTAKNLEQRLEHLNTLRDEVQKDRGLFVTKLVYDEMHNSLSNRVERIEAVQSKMIGVGSALIVVAGILGAVITHIFTK